ncbi:hypothetical protein PhCBS80983_g02739 [Powellomyces hirtus]|uniref:Fork-head domain-containing protein n=1 Tax=Powellomyces hirtus TaxID=109895 RepID=A0A507E5G8_9FUNG|nr:hypothetical protein PhCBS80983_g02739 [Powellomyces hirtus]
MVTQSIIAAEGLNNPSLYNLHSSTQPSFTSINEHPISAFSDGFALLLAAAAAYEDDQPTFVDPIHVQNAPITPPGSPYHSTDSCVGNNSGPGGDILVVGDVSKSISIGHGDSFTINLLLNNGSVCPPQLGFLLIEWNPVIHAFELRVFGSGVVSVGLFNHFGEKNPPAVLETMTRFKFQNWTFCFFKPVGVGAPHGLSFSSASYLPSPVLSPTTSTSKFDLRTPPLARGLVPSASPFIDLVASVAESTSGLHGSSTVLPRPNIPWANMIIRAFKSSGKRELLVSEIYDTIILTHPYYAARRNNKNWRNAVRHALSVNTCFFRLNGNEYKCGLWGYHEKLGPTTCRKGRRRQQEPQAQHSTSSSRLSNINVTDVSHQQFATMALPPPLRRSAGLDVAGTTQCSGNSALDWDMKMRLAPVPSLHP